MDTDRATVSSPGITLPKTTVFKAYTGESRGPTQWFLHSESHTTLDYTASEEALQDPDSLSHYVGIFSPQDGSMRLVPARQMVARSTLKSSRAHDIEAQTEGTHISPLKISSRSELGLAFGSKKTRKLIESRVANALVDSKPFAENKTANAIVDGMPEQTVNKNESKAQIDAARPIPKPNMEAKTPAEVYTIQTLTGGDEVLAKIKVKTWMDALGNGEDLMLRSRFVSNRCLSIAQSGDTARMRLLRYTYLLICWYRSLRPAKSAKDSKVHVPKFAEPMLSANNDQAPFMQTVLHEFGRDMIAHLSDFFCENGSSLERWHQDRLIGHILAMTLLVDRCETETYDIQFDLRLDIKKTSDYYKGLGCTLRKLNKGEIERKGLARIEAMDRRKVTLPLPLKLPAPKKFVMKRK